MKQIKENKNEKRTWNLRAQVRQVLDEKTRLGTSRHEAKKEAKKTDKNYKVTQSVGFIASTTTRNEYGKVWSQVMDYASEQGQKMRADFQEIGRKLGREYLENCKTRGLSPWTLQKYRSAINMALTKKITDKDFHIEPRKVGDVVRGRIEHSEAYKAKFQKEIFISEATGARVAKLKTLKRSNFSYRDGRLMVTFGKDKGGKPRTVPVLKSHQKGMEQLLRDLGKHDYLVSRATRLGHDITSHQERRDYAKNLYDELMAGREPGKTTEINGKAYDKAAAMEVSKALGHNRLDVLANYL